MADAAGHLRFALPKAYGGQDGSNLWMAVIREHLAAKGLGLHNDLQTEHSIVANNPFVLMLRDFGTPEQQREFIDGMLERALPRDLRPDRSRTRLRRHPHGHQGGGRDAQRRGRLAHRRREDVDHRHAYRQPLPAVRAQQRHTPATRAASAPSSCRRKHRA